jgi:hypothetical protein
MALSPMQRRSTYTWMWIALGIVLVIAVIWWAGDTGPAIPSDTTGAGTVEAVQPADATQPAAIEQSGNPGAAGAAAPTKSATD